MTVEQLFFNCIWNNKPDKIKRNTLCPDYKRGDGGWVGVGGGGGGVVCVCVSENV